MSWGGGTDIMFDMMRSFDRDDVEDAVRRQLYVDLIKSLWDQDWGSADECLGNDPMFDEALEIASKERG
jgi:hypothetical protein